MIGVHVYPGDMVKLITSVSRPDYSVRGEKEFAIASKKQG